MLSTGILELDVHGMKKVQAKSYIDGQLKKIQKSVYQVRIIHGYHGGTELRDMIQWEYREHPKVIRMQMGTNPGETVLILREL